jgi:hypothetical protein
MSDVIIGHCAQCIERYRGEPRPFSVVADESDPDCVFRVLCAICGPTLINASGRCVSPDCFRAHGSLRSYGPSRP